LVAERIANIGSRGVRRRRRTGWISLAVAGVIIAALIALHAPRMYRLILGIPIGIAALNLLQAREKT
jgi:uncharacterized membrane protein HdeD (DUF308 family)